MTYRLLAAVALLATATTQALAQGLPTTAVMHFGNMGTGSPFSPVLQHDESIHAADKMVPRTVTVAVGGTVTFVFSNPVHGAAVYASGTTVDDINLGAVSLIAGCPPAPYINDPDDRIAQFAPICGGGNPSNQLQFNTPGRYLVICSFAPHFGEADMWGWVIVGARPE